MAYLQVRLMVKILRYVFLLKVTFCCIYVCLKDIRKFFSGAAVTQTKSKETSSMPSNVDIDAKTQVKHTDRKTENSTKQKSKCLSGTIGSKPSNRASAGTEDICVIDLESESEDFACKQSKKTINNNNDKVNKRLKVRSSGKRRSKTAATGSHVECDVEPDEQTSTSACNSKVSEKAGKQSKGKKVDETSGSNSPPRTTLKSDNSHHQVKLNIVKTLN